MPLCLDTIIDNLLLAKE